MQKLNPDMRARDQEGEQGLVFCSDVCQVMAKTYTLPTSYGSFFKIY